MYVQNLTESSPPESLNSVPKVRFVALLSDATVIADKNLFGDRACRVVRSYDGLYTDISPRDND